MKIVHVESGRHLYGGARQVAYLIKGLSDRRIDNVLVCTSPQIFDGNLSGAEIVAMTMAGDLDFGMVRRLERVFKRIDPDLIHVHSRRGADLFTGLAIKSGRWPAILTRRVDNPELRSWAQYKYRPYTRLVAISQAVQTQLRDRVGIEARRLRCIASAVDADRFHPNRSARARLIHDFELGEGDFIIGVVAQLIQRKGHAALLDCITELIRRHRHIKVLCFGRGPLERQLQRRIASLKLSPYVKLTGFRADIDALLPGLDLLVHPAEREGLGVAVLEAMSCEIAVVACQAGGLADLIDSGIEGLLVPVGSRDQLVAAVERLVADSEAREAMGKMGRIRVKRDFSVDRMSERYLELYRSVCESRYDNK